MADPRFFERAGPFSLGELASRIGAELVDPTQASKQIIDVAPLDQANGEQLAFLDNPKYADAFAATKAGACILHEKHRSLAPPDVALLLSPKPYLSYARAAQLFYPAPKPPAGIHPSAVIQDGAKLGEGISISPLAVIEAGAEIGPGSSIGSGTVVGRNVVIGADCRIGPSVTLTHCIIGSRVTLHPGVRIGQDGFGFAPDPTGHVKVPQLGRVVIGDDCEIGANTTVDRGAGPDTVIGPGCWIDNLVQIGHNVTLGRGCIVVAQAGIAGSTQLGDFVVLAAQSGVAGHLKLGMGARVGAKSGVMTDIPAGESYFGIPATRVKEYFRQVATLRRLTQKKGAQNE
ncbi:UDP-3-O-(3-hydroxymyristoyl)glucosamine N-acyltransferase [uncultured Ferrovibrio sp.]|jgi:UDP-3-O-[3-hydroxymyristoyl] glucosamine N-acyltransferase|uniref:UDP-3-O-(3-hydroxymyristoyl)glucosamine N-acyltransferase n=1 Tax=uncultured Ferrovibrio sp. TaxID=1576913 RepID=UPI0026346E07|nr:UDP-3-O-(3-hydroxymyristoyl)glucosamine N-acyltransferase [uncultured Ferrovibrio sp.]